MVINRVILFHFATILLVRSICLWPCMNLEATNIEGHPDNVPKRWKLANGRGVPIG